MICPDGFFTPLTLRGRFLNALSNDRVHSIVFHSAGRQFDRIPVVDRIAVFNSAADLFTHWYLRSKQEYLFLFCPTRAAPLKIDPWIMRSKHELPHLLPECVTQASQISDELNNQFAFVCCGNWAVDKNNVDLTKHVLSRPEAVCLEKIDGWSVCFKDELLPKDYGQLLQSIAVEMDRRKREKNSPPKKLGRKPKVGPLADQIRDMYSNKVPDKPAKEIERDLRSIGFSSFGDTTLRAATNAAKENQ